LKLAKILGKLRNRDQMQPFNVTLISTTHSEMMVMARSANDARERAVIQLAGMGWLEWTIGKAWKITP